MCLGRSRLDRQADFAPLSHICRLDEVLVGVDVDDRKRSYTTADVSRVVFEGGRGRRFL